MQEAQAYVSCFRVRPARQWTHGVSTSRCVPVRTNIFILKASPKPGLWRQFFKAKAYKFHASVVLTGKTIVYEFESRPTLRIKFMKYLHFFLRQIHTLKKAFWSFKSGFLPVFLETLIKHFILLVLVYLGIIYGSAYFIFKTHDIFQYGPSFFLIWLITLRLIYDLPSIVEMFILASAGQLSSVEVLKESLHAYFTLHWHNALALALLAANVLYFSVSVCKLIWATLSKSNSVWDRRCAYLLLSLLVMVFILFLVYCLTPFFSDVYNQGWASTIVSYLWKSLKFTTDPRCNKTNGASKSTQSAREDPSKAQ